MHEYVTMRLSSIFVFRNLQFIDCLLNLGNSVKKLWAVLIAVMGSKNDFWQSWGI